MPQTNTGGDAVQTLCVEKDVFIAATPDIVWESILDEVGGKMHPEGGPEMAMKIEPRPGGRWYRDLGNDAGHFWGHVQVIKPPKILEICGPLFMSYPAMNHLQYRLTEERDGTRMKFTHRGVGIFDPEQIKGVDMGWGGIVERIRKAAEQRASR